MLISGILERTAKQLGTLKFKIPNVSQIRELDVLNLSKLPMFFIITNRALPFQLWNSDSEFWIWTQTRRDFKFQSFWCSEHLNFGFWNFKWFKSIEASVWKVFIANHSRSLSPSEHLLREWFSNDSRARARVFGVKSWKICCFPLSLCFCGPKSKNY